jgi:hypothetical protein
LLLLAHPLSRNVQPRTHTSALLSALQMPQQLAIVMGSEAAGVSQEMREAADRWATLLACCSTSECLFEVVVPMLTNSHCLVSSDWTASAQPQSWPTSTLHF